MDKKLLNKLCHLIRYDILTATTEAGSGHPTSSLSGVELLTILFFDGFLKLDPGNPKNINNDRFILSKGHASPLLYSLYHAAGLIDEKKLLTLRKFGSDLEGHPTPRLPLVDVSTGSLGQGLSVGVGMAMAMKLKGRDKSKVWVMLGDSEAAEGQVWEAIQSASFHRLNNLVAILDVNRLGQNGETMVGWEIDSYAKRVSAFGWKTILVEDGHDLDLVHKAFTQTRKQDGPIMIIARTTKGKGVSFIENKDGWHGKPLNKEQLKVAIDALGQVDFDVRGEITKLDSQPVRSNDSISSEPERLTIYSPTHNPLTEVATREAYGNALVEVGSTNPNIVVLDAEVGNSTYHNNFKKQFPERFFQMYIAEQNMVSAALGFQKLGFVPFVSTFAAFLSRAFDQIRMSQYSDSNIKIVGSHAGVSIGEDGSSQMGLEDISMMRSILRSTVFYPSDAVSTKKLTEIMAKTEGLFYLRTTRGKTPIIYDEKEDFRIGGCKVHKAKGVSSSPFAIVIAAGITLHEAIKAQGELAKKGVNVTVVDLYSVKPLDEKTIRSLTEKAGNLVVVEDHYPAGGIGEAIGSLGLKFIHLAAHKTPMSGTPKELLHFEEIDADAIVKAVQSF